MSTSRGPSVKPIIVEVKPDNASSMAPSTPPMAKAVRFANNTSGLVTGVTRPLSRDEAWSLYHFENHARRCATCTDPMAVYRRGDRLCEYGYALAQDVAQHVYYAHGQIYSLEPQKDGKPVSVEIPLEYDQLRSLLKAMDRGQRSSSRKSPVVINYTTYPPASPKSPRERRASSSGGNSNTSSDDRRPEIILEPGTSASASRRKSVHRPARYATIVVDDSVERQVASTPSSPTKERRGTLYEKDMQSRRKEAYRVEIREPDGRKERRRREEGRWL